MYIRAFVIATALVVAMATTASAVEFKFVNGAAPANWQEATRSGIPAPAPLAIVDGIQYRLGDPGVRFHRYDVGGVQIILGDCSPDSAARTLALEFYTNGAFSELLDCDAIDGNHTP